MNCRDSLLSATAAGNLAEVRRLAHEYAAAADFGAVVRGCLRCAAIYGRERVARFLVSIGAPAYEPNYARLAATYNEFGVMRFLVSIGTAVGGAFRIIVLSASDDMQYLYVCGVISLRIKWRCAEYERSRLARAAGVAYFWWVPRCYDRRRRAGRRSARRNYSGFQRLCAN